MKTIQVHDKSFSVLLDEQTIQNRIKEVCVEINQRYKNRRPVFLSVLNGAFMFAADVMKNIETDCEITFVKLKSYIGDQSSGKVKAMIGLDTELQGRDVVILEDIVDTGETMLQFLPSLLNLNPSSVAVFTLLLKKQTLKYPIKLDYVGFEISDEFVVGYGLDYNGLGRQYKEIYQLAAK